MKNLSQVLENLSFTDFLVALGQKAVCKPKGHKGSNSRLLWSVFLKNFPKLWLKHKRTEFSLVLMIFHRHPKTMGCGEARDLEGPKSPDAMGSCVRYLQF